MGPTSGAVVIPITSEAAPNLSELDVTESERSLGNTIQQNEILSKDLEQWNALESSLMKASTNDDLKLAVVAMQKVFLENPQLCENIGLEPVISAGKAKKDDAPDMWTPDVAQSFGALLRIIKLHYRPNAEFSPDTTTPRSKGKCGENARPSGAASLRNLDFFRNSLFSGNCGRYGLYFLAFFSSLLAFLSVQALVLFVSEFLFPAFPYVLAAALAIMAIIAVPFISHRIVHAGVHIDQLSNVTVKIVTLKLFRNSTYVLIFFCFAGAPTAGTVTSYNITVAVMALVLYFVVCYVYYYRVCEVLDARDNEDRQVEADIFTEETGYQISRDEITMRA